jgi:hypothetical protein
MTSRVWVEQAGIPEWLARPVLYFCDEEDGSKQAAQSNLSSSRCAESSHFWNSYTLVRQ